MKNLFCVVFFLFVVNFVFSQQSIVVSGETQKGLSGEISYTIGLPIYGMAENNGEALTIGVQQVFEIISIISSSENIVNHSDLNMVITPNPFVDIVSVTFESDDLSDETYFLWIYDQSGNIVGNFTFADKKIYCNLSHLPSGIYYFALISREYQLKQYLKLIKQ
jgi:hypothetical protein